MDHSLSLERRFRAPPALVYAAWTDPEALPRWFGPRGWICETEVLDLRVGGEWRFTMRGEGMAFANRHRWLELVPHERIVFLMDGMGGREPMRVTVTLAPEGTGTRLCQVTQFPDASALAFARGFDAEAKGQETLTKLAAHLGE
jgi:uncharacterized protein YndB with AHSA1/START domain